MAEFTWQGEERLTYTEGESGEPSISFDNGKVHVVWIEDVDSTGYEIFYKRFTPDSSDAVVDQVKPPLPDFSISAYPNPLNSTTILSIGNGKAADIFIYDITGRQIASLVAKEGKAVWDASAYSSGIYFARASGGNKSSVIKLIYLK